MKKIHQKSTFIHIGNKTKCIINYEVIDSKSKAILFKGKATGIAKLSLKILIIIFLEEELLNLELLSK